MSTTRDPADAQHDSVVVESAGPVAIITLNRPARLNAWTAQMEESYFDALDRLSADDRVRAIVLTGAGRGFCAGADMDDLDQIPVSGPEGVVRNRPKTYPLGIPKPIIAAVNGACAGMGFVQALMCDVRFAEEEAIFTTSFSKLGLIAEHGSSWLLAKHVGIGHSLDLLLSARKVTASEAASMGLVSKVHKAGTVLEEAVKYAESLSQSSSPAAMATIKRQVYSHYLLDLREALELANAEMLSSLAEPDFREGVDSFVERRSPSFSGLSAKYRDFGPGHRD